MKCLTDKELQDMLEQQDARMIAYEQLDYPKSDKKLMVTLPENIKRLNFFALYLADWLLDGNEGVIYLSRYGNGELVHPVTVFEKLRNACGETRPIGETPTHLFDMTNAQEKAIMTGMMFLVMAYDWDGCFFTRSGRNYIYTSDEYLSFSSDSETKIDEAYEMTDSFQLRRRDRWVGKLAPK